MKKQSTIITAALLLFVILSCALESKFGLPNNEKINTELLGDWCNLDNGNECISILKNGRKTYKIVLQENDKEETLIAYSKTINGFHIMNIKINYDDEITNVFYGFTLNGNSLVFSEVNDKLRKNKFTSKAELLGYFKEHITAENFFINHTELRRKQ
jgi:hypothetical protein